MWLNRFIPPYSIPKASLLNFTLAYQILSFSGVGFTAEVLSAIIIHEHLNRLKIGVSSSANRVVSSNPVLLSYTVTLPSVNLYFG